MCGSCHGGNSEFHDCFQHVAYQTPGQPLWRSRHLVHALDFSVSQHRISFFFFFKYGLEMTIFQNFKYFQTSFRLKSRCFQIKIVYKAPLRDFPGGPVVKNLPANAEDTGLIPVLGGSHMPWGNQIRALQLLKPALYSP